LEKRKLKIMEITGEKLLEKIKNGDGGNVTNTKVGVLQENEIKGLVQELING